MSEDAKMGNEMNLSFAGYGMSYVLSSPYENVPTDLSSHVKDQGTGGGHDLESRLKWHREESSGILSPG